MTLFIASGFFLAGCGGPKDGRPHGPPPGMAVNVVGVKVTVESIEEKIALVGTLAPNESVDIKGEIDGKVKEIGFEEGDTVKAGDVLFLIDDAAIKASLDDAQARLKLAETTVDRLQGLVESRAISQQEYDEAMANLATGRAQVALMKEQLDNAVITAPFDGIMGQRLISLGQYISRGMSLSFLTSSDPVKAEFAVPERYLSRIKSGQTVELQVSAYPDDVFKGQVYFIDPQINVETRTVLMKARVPNQEGRLRPGMFANLDLIVSSRSRALVIPETALIVKGDTVSVYVIGEDGKAGLVPVTTGIRLAGRVEITEGLKAGDVIVTEGYQKLREGADASVRFEEE